MARNVILIRVDLSEADLGFNALVADFDLFLGLDLFVERDSLVVAAAVRTDLMQLGGCISHARGVLLADSRKSQHAGPLELLHVLIRHLGEIFAGKVLH